MLVPGQLIEVKINKKNLRHYINLGYNVQYNDIIVVPPEHLTSGAHIIVNVKCDICGKIVQKKYKDYLKTHTYDTDSCKECYSEKIKMACLNKYGVENVFQLDEVKQKTKNTFMSTYGCDHPMHNDEIKQRLQETNLDKYGTAWCLQAPEVKEKIKKTILLKYGVSTLLQNSDIMGKIIKTNLQKYGVKYTIQSKETREKSKKTLLRKYGVESPMQSKEIKKKAMETMCKNGNEKVSRQQILLYEIIKEKYPTAELNYPFSGCLLDIFICIDNINIDVEYDGSYWHQDQQRDIKRDKFLQSNGFKTLRIRSGHLLPTEEELFNAIDYLVNTEHHFKEIILSDWRQKEGEQCQEQLQAEA